VGERENKAVVAEVVSGRKRSEGVRACLDRYLKTTPGPGSFPRPSISNAWGWIDLPGRGSLGEAAIQTSP